MVQFVTCGATLKYPPFLPVFPLLIVAAIVVLLLYYYQQYFPKKNKLKLNEKLLFLTAAIIIFIAGYILYFYGFNEKGTQNNYHALILRPTISSLEMFVSHSDLLEVGEYWHKDPFYMTCFAWTHFLAVIISATFAIHFLGFRFISWLRLRMASTNIAKQDLYLFFGVNEASVLLAKDLVSKAENQEDPNDKNKKRKCSKIIFIEATAEEENNQRMSFSHILGLFSYKRSIIETVNKLNAILVYSKTSIAKTEAAGPNILESLGIGRVCRLIEKANSLKLFFLSEDENANVSSVIKLLKDKTLNTSLKTEIYCHARRNNQNIILENMAVYRKDTSKITVRIIDSSYLSILSLKMYPAYHPVNFVNPDPARAIAREPFTALIVGFGETGQDALAFLYEFSAFVNEKGQENPFKCYVIDQKMNGLKGNFYMKVPALAGNNEIKLVQCSNREPGFWEKLELIINDLNYVVIAIGEDKKGMSFAIDLYEFACKHRKNTSDRFKIFIRSYDPVNYAQLKEIADYYNNNSKGREEIVVFGAMKDIFTYNIIINAQTQKNAQCFYYEYVKSRQGKGETESEPNPEEQWEARRKKLTTGIANHRKLMQQEFQDMANSWHIETKMRLVGIRDRNDRKLDEMINCTEGRNKDSTDYPNANEQQKIVLKNLAKCEHLRWKASNEILGYVTYDIQEGDDNKKDYISKKLSCLVSCDRLEEITALKSTICYDCSTVDISFRIKKNGWNYYLKEDSFTDS